MCSRFPDVIPMQEFNFEIPEAALILLPTDLISKTKGLGVTSHGRYEPVIYLCLETFLVVINMFDDILTIPAPTLGIKIVVIWWL